MLYVYIDFFCDLDKLVLIGFFSPLNIYFCLDYAHIKSLVKIIYYGSSEPFRTYLHIYLPRLFIKTAGAVKERPGAEALISDFDFKVKMRAGGITGGPDFAY